MLYTNDWLRSSLSALYIEESCDKCCSVFYSDSIHGWRERWTDAGRDNLKW